jgi:hypothetical protein
VIFAAQKNTREGRNAMKATPAKKSPRAKPAFSLLEKNILLSKGITEGQFRLMQKKGIDCREAFSQIGDPETLAGLVGISAETAGKVLAWAAASGAPGPGRIVVESGDVMHCVHCGTKQPKDYKTGDLCISCGNQAEPILGCFWCGSCGPGKYCRQCGAVFVPTGDLPLALLLRREGVAKQEIAEKLRSMSDEDKQVLWGRVRRS